MGPCRAAMLPNRAARLVRGSQRSACWERWCPAACSSTWQPYASVGMRPGRLARFQCGLGALGAWRHHSSTGAVGGGLAESLARGEHQRFVFVGGKGGVGKTTTAAAIAVRMAKTGRKTLVVSTDPAHSLGDALAMRLSGEPQRVLLPGEEPDAEGESAGGLLWAMEIDPAETVEDVRRALKLDGLREALRERRGGLGAGLLAALAQAGVDLECIVTLLELSPPGIDEAVALGQLMQLLGDKNHGDFERVVIDTAPTGHTLRLLAFPQFLHGLIATLLAVNEKVSGFSMMPRFLGHIVGDDLQQQLKITKANLERIMAAMGALNSVFSDAGATSFVVVTIPTHLAVTESRRLLLALEQAQMPARHIIINQYPFLNANDGSDDAVHARAAAAKVAANPGALGISADEADALHRTMERLLHQYDDAQKQASVLENEVGTEVQIFRMPVFKEELTGTAALDRYGAMLRRP